MEANKQGGGKCPFCDKTKKNLNSHIVQSAGGGHGPGREYPNTWNPDDRELIDEPEPDGSAVEGTGGGEPETGGEVFDLDRAIEEENESENESSSGSTSSETSKLELGFDDINPREYECGNCQKSIPYLGGNDRDGGGKECPECRERLWWSEVNE